MASRKDESALKIPTKQNGNGHEESPISSILLDYLVKPIHLPAFQLNKSAHESYIVDTIQDLLADTFGRILPEKVVGVQFVFAKRTKHKGKQSREKNADFSFPFILCCASREEARRYSDGLAFVTKLLMGHDSSFHVRVRNSGLTYSPAVCIFSRFPYAGKSDDLFFKSANVLWVHIPQPGDLDPVIGFPDDEISELPIDSDSGILFRADLHSAINRGFYDDGQSTPVNLDLNHHPPNLKIVCQSSPDAERRRRKLQAMCRGLLSDRDYLKRVSYLLRFGDVILCTPHAYDEDYSHGEESDSHEFITDAGLTVIVDPNKGRITEDDWLRVQVVAQKLAIFSGAAISSVADTRASMLEMLNDGFSHEFGNMSRNIVADLNELYKANEPVPKAAVDEIEGQFQFTQYFLDSAMWFYEHNTDDVYKIIDALINPIKKYRDVAIQVEIGPADDTRLYLIDKLWMRVLAEGLRNAYQHGLASNEDQKIHVQLRVSFYNHPGRVTASIGNVAKRNYRMSSDRQGWALMQKLARRLHGEVTASEEGELFWVNIEMPMMSIGG